MVSYVAWSALESQMPGNSESPSLQRQTHLHYVSFFGKMDFESMTLEVLKNVANCVATMTQQI